MSITSQAVPEAGAWAGTPPDAAAMIRVESLVKRYPKRSDNAVDGVSFTVPRGEAFGLLGPNGAGKTTTIGVLTTRVRPTGGRAFVAGVDVSRDPTNAKRHFAVVPQRNNPDRSLTARQNLVFHAAYFGFSRHEREQRADELLTLFGLEGRGGDKTDKYSGGMAQRLMIARALMHDPELLFLDEPTTGLDPQARLFVWDRVKDLKTRGLTVLLTTHDMDEAETLCSRVAIMDHGKILALDTPEALKTLVPGASALELQVAFPDAAAAEPDGRVEALPDALRAARRGAPGGATARAGWSDTVGGGSVGRRTPRRDTCDAAGAASAGRAAAHPPLRRQRRRADRARRHGRGATWRRGQRPARVAG